MQLLAHRGVVLIEPALLPALVPDGWQDVPHEGVRLVQAGGFLLAPTEQPGDAVRALAEEGPAALLFIGSCASPTRDLEPGDVLLVERARTRLGEVGASAPLVAKLRRRCDAAGLDAKVGSVASGMPAAQQDLGEDQGCGAVLRAAKDAGLPACALLVCAGAETGVGDAPVAVLESFDTLFQVVQGVLGKPDA
ncbi:MAG: hypothetical protein LC624_12710 [Halobacteriales archaeon]|nr:hypothetical protein [Halobacteriales archaeon]